MTRHISMIVGALICLSSAAWAQRQKPRILIVFDTSGSMGADVLTGNPTGGDNSEAYPGNGGTSRLAVAKSAIASLVETTSEVEFALMRYPQIEGDGINRGILDGRQQNTYEGLEDNPLNYAGECAGVLDRGGDAASALLTGFAPDNEPGLLRWMDNTEAWPGDPELRAEGPTPIVETLRLAEQYYRTVLPADGDFLRCRRNYVLVLTDGGESCVPQDDREVALTDVANALRMVPVEIDGQVVEKDVQTFVVAFGVNQRARQALGALARAGGTAVGLDGRPDLERGLPFAANDLDGLREAFGRILSDAIPVELCNDLDDDCDGVVDEGARNACGGCGAPPEEVCDEIDQDCDGRIDEGVLNPCGGCGAVPDEVCNDFDDDCDGEVDEAVQNACGGCAAVSPEVCNNLDDDCDGLVDNLGEAPLERPCGQAVGECTAGLQACVDGMWGACDGVVGVDELCDGLDNDCDGAIDERDLPCGPVEIGDVGECRVGRRRCDPAQCADGACEEDGWLSECIDAAGPGEEVCNGRDDDCDGEADEGLFNACGRCGPTPAEACNGEDDNCDGRVDEDALCPVNLVCYAGECVAACDASGECRGQFACLPVYPGGRFCHPNPCAGANCPGGLVCDPEVRGCVDLCADVDCGDDACELGECVPRTCRHDGCADGERCVGDACEADPCVDVDCGMDGFCREGECVPVCREQVCGEGRACRDGECVDDPCGGRCIRSQVCDTTDGACVADPCRAVNCPVGSACVDGECATDAPCVSIRCPAGTRCVDGTCTDETPGVFPVLRPPVLDMGVAPDFGPDAAVVEPDFAVEPLPEPAPEAGEDEGCQQTGGGGALWLLLFAVRRRAGSS